MFIDHLAVFSDALGVENAPTVVYLSMVPWPDNDTRDDFIKSLTGRDPRYDING